MDNGVGLTVGEGVNEVGDEAFEGVVLDELFVDFGVVFEEGEHDGGQENLARETRKTSRKRVDGTGVKRFEKEIWRRIIRRHEPERLRPMTKEQLKQLEADLWAAADNLRANSDLNRASIRRRCSNRDRYR